MNLREYNKTIKDLDAQLDVLWKQRKEVEFQFKSACSHPEKNLVVEHYYNEDEYGRTFWDSPEYNYKCTRCGTELNYLKNKVNNIKELRVALNEAVAKSKPSQRKTK